MPRITAESDQGIKNNTLDEAIKLAGENPDFGITDMWDSIEAGNYPSWTIYFQAMNASQAEKFKCKCTTLVQDDISDPSCP